jgi:hypothetical protein
MIPHIAKTDALIPYRGQRAFSRRTHTLITSPRATQAPVLWVSSRTSVHRTCRSWTRLTSANQPSTAPRIVWRPTGSWAPEKTAERYGIRYADGPDFCLPRFIMETFESIGLPGPSSRSPHACDPPDSPEAPRAERTWQQTCARPHRTAAARDRVQWRPRGNALCLQTPLRLPSDAISSTKIEQADGWESLCHEQSRGLGLTFSTMPNWRQHGRTSW